MTCPADIDDIVVINVVIVADECDLLTFLAFVGKTVARAQQSLDVPAQNSCLADVEGIVSTAPDAPVGWARCTEAAQDRLPKHPLRRLYWESAMEETGL
eukprot:s6736_g5.t1